MRSRSRGLRPFAEQFFHGFARAAQLHCALRNDDRTIDKDRMRHHGVEQFFVAGVQLIEPKFPIKRLLGSNDGSHP